MRIPHANEYEPAPEGMHLAICRAIVDLGSQAVQYKGKPNGKRRQVSMAFELIGAVNSNGNPFTVWRQSVTLSTAPKSSFLPILEALLGHMYGKNEELDLNHLVGRGCEIVIEHQRGGDDGTMTFANIVAFHPWPAGRRVPQAQGQCFYVSLEPEEFNGDFWGLIPQGMRSKIELSAEYEKIMSPDMVNEDTALSLAKPSRRTASPPSEPDYESNFRPQTKAEVERMIKNPPETPPYTEADAPPNYDDMEDVPF